MESYNLERVPPKAGEFTCRNSDGVARGLGGDVVIFHLSTIDHLVAGQPQSDRHGRYPGVQDTLIDDRSGIPDELEWKGVGGVGRGFVVGSDASHLPRLSGNERVADLRFLADAVPKWAFIANERALTWYRIVFP